MKKEISLCYPCYLDHARAFELTEIKAPANKKITCDGCGKRRFGAVYAVGAKKEREVDKGEGHTQAGRQV